MNYLKDVKEGDKLWSIQLGWCVVTCNDSTSNNNYDIEVETDNMEESYTIDGKLDKFDENPSLFFDKPNFDKSLFKPKLPHIEVDQIIEVWCVYNRYLRRFCKYDSSGRVVCYWDGESSSNHNHDTLTWENHRILKEL